MRSCVRLLVVAGGETSGAVVDRLGIPGFLVGVEIAAGVPVLRAVGAKDDEMLLALKSGNFGGPEFFSDALKLMLSRWSAPFTDSGPEAARMPEGGQSVVNLRRWRAR